MGGLLWIRSFSASISGKMLLANVAFNGLTSARILSTARIACCFLSSAAARRDAGLASNFKGGCGTAGLAAIVGGCFTRNSKLNVD